MGILFVEADHVVIFLVAQWEASERVEYPVYVYIVSFHFCRQVCHVEVGVGSERALSDC